jgi:hypothetical protein
VSALARAFSLPPLSLSPLPLACCCPRMALGLGPQIKPGLRVGRWANRTHARTHTAQGASGSVGQPHARTMVPFWWWPGCTYHLRVGWHVATQPEGPSIASTTTAVLRWATTVCTRSRRMESSGTSRGTPCTLRALGRLPPTQGARPCTTTPSPLTMEQAWILKAGSGLLSCSTWKRVRPPGCLMAGSCPTAECLGAPWLKRSGPNRVRSEAHAKPRQCLCFKSVSARYVE